MQKIVHRIILGLLVAQLPAGAVFAEDISMPQPLNTDHPSTNQLNPAPDDPPAVNSSSSDIHKVPAEVPKKTKGIVYDPGRTKIDDKNLPSAPSNDDAPYPNSGNTGIEIPVPATGGRGR